MGSDTLTYIPTLAAAKSVSDINKVLVDFQLSLKTDQQLNSFPGSLAVKQVVKMSRYYVYLPPGQAAQATGRLPV